MRNKINQYFINFLVNGFLMSSLIPVFLRRFILNLWSGGVKGAVQPHCIITSSRFKLGKKSYINRRCLIDNGHATVSVGNNCTIGCDVKFLTTNHDFSDSKRRGGKVSGVDIIVEDSCWIGAGVVLLPGTVVHHGVVVAAGSIVRGELEADSIYAGVLAKKIRSLN